jgi:sensor histidine kinase YesM
MFRSHNTNRIGLIFMWKRAQGLVSPRIQHYVPIFLYASIFWMTLGTLHLSALSLGDIQAGKNYNLSAQRWALFLWSYFSWAFLTTFVYALIEKNLPSRDNWRWLLGFVLTMGAWLGIISIIVQFLNSVLWGFAPEPVWEMLSNTTPFLYLFNALKFAMTYGACTGIVYYRRLQDAKLELLKLERLTAEVMEKKSRFELQALQAQLSPHFLFNALNSVSAMARNNDSSGIVKAVSHLADLLRYAVEATNQTVVNLDEELKFTANYIALQKMRFGDGFRYDIDVQLNDSFSNCPPFCIQTLVENVFSHNELSTAQPLLIRVRIFQVEGCLSIEVENTVAAPVEKSGPGVGLRNLAERLHLLYGESAHLSAQLNPAGFAATINMPMRAGHD